MSSLLQKPLQQWLLLKRPDPHLRAAVQSVFAGPHYFVMHPEIADSGLLPAVDYFLCGASEGRDPHPLFNTRYYLEQNPDVAASSQNPLLHYIRFGAAEGRNPHWLFDTKYYLARYPDASQGGHPFLHYLLHGQFEHLQPSPFLTLSSISARRWTPTKGGALTHYQLHGFREGRSPAVDFDTAFYLRTHQDVARAGLSPSCTLSNSARPKAASPARPAWKVTILKRICRLLSALRLRSPCALSVSLFPYIVDCGNAQVSGKSVCFAQYSANKRDGNQ